MVHSWSMVRSCGLVHVSIVRAVNPVVATTVAHEHLWMCIVEMPFVVVSVYCECPSASLPSHGAIEVGESHILVILPAVQDIAEISVTAIPPDAEDSSSSSYRYLLSLKS